MAPPTIAITGASGKLGGATFSALLSHSLAPPASMIALTSSHPSSATWTALASAARGVQVRHASYDEPVESFAEALRGVDRLFLVSTPRVALDFDDAKAGGREMHHKVAIDAAVMAGVGRVYYSSLAFGFDGKRARVKGGGDEEDGIDAEEEEGVTKGTTNHSKAGVMRAHLRTEAYLRECSVKHGLGVTVLREGLYNESWPLYLGYFAPSGRDDDRAVVPLAGDGRICWTAIKDLGIASAVVLAASGEDDVYRGRTFYLSTRPRTARSMKEIAAMVGRARGREVRVEVVGRKEHERYYVQERGLDRAAVEWWASTYEAMEEGECLIDDPTLERLLGSVGVTATPVEETVAAMVKGGTETG
ncbi:Uu.00g068900.m01.CDS01 [Anthostomella pinea]|uniref:Uu.00g068900.m01.CDS01 n=1 Tax=Anthostomella pinea TaxID=933095 RepID=A0AAI8VV94_9PEZI|nr:Uu.00g068900.m01.CDS01 [Anthostomella pinea]